jgi:hypothetical protein
MRALAQEVESGDPWSAESLAERVKGRTRGTEFIDQYTYHRVGPGQIVDSRGPRSADREKVINQR